MSPFLFEKFLLGDSKIMSLKRTKNRTFACHPSAKKTFWRHLFIETSSRRKKDVLTTCLRHLFRIWAATNFVFLVCLRDIFIESPSRSIFLSFNFQVFNSKLNTGLNCLLWIRDLRQRGSNDSNPP